MADLTRFGVSIEKSLLKKFDKLIKDEDYANRSEAFRDLIRDKLVETAWSKKGKVAGAIVLVYDHHKHDLLDKLTHFQHEHSSLIISTQHVHFDHHNCLEIIVTKGSAKEVESLAAKMRSVKGVKYGQLAMAATGQEMD
jgi:CopG family nickel-responsive transcriptional regulator